MGYRGILLLACFCAGPVSAATINVPADQSTIQAAINAANTGDTVLVAPGTYYEKIDFKGKAITVTSSGGAAATILDGQNKSPIVTFDTGEGNNSVLQGFTITHANGSNFGSAVYILGSASPMILDNIFSYNTLSPGLWGAAIGGDGLGSPVILRNFFTHNVCSIEYAGGSVVGFGYAGSPVVADNVFVNNPCAAIYVLLRYSAAPKVYNNTIVGNAEGIYLQLNTVNPGTVFSNNLIAYNQYGLSAGSSPALPWTNNLVYGNTTADYGGISNQTGIAGNISSDPQLKYWVSGDVHLLSHSPAIDAGDSTVSQDSITDYYGDTRIYAGNPGEPAVVDIGAVESIAPDDVPGTAPVINVPGDEPTIQDAIDAASDGDMVLVAPGTYYEKLNFKGKAITVKGTAAADTILDGHAGGPIVTFYDGEGYGSVLQGFTLANAQPTTEIIGTAISLSGLSSPQIVGNIFTNNTEYSGLWGAAIGGNNASAVIVGNLFENNICYDGVIAFKNTAAPSIVNNVFLNNVGGGDGCAAISAPSGPVYISNNTFVGNTIGIRTQAEVGDAVQTYRNNLLYGNLVGLDVDVIGSPGGYPIWKNNLVFGNTTANYQGMSDQTGTNANLSADPMFADVAGGSVKLTYGSPAIDVGDMSAPILPATDYYGESEPFAGIPNGTATVDIGASEYHPPLVTAKGDGVAVAVDTPGNGTLMSAGADPGEPVTYAIVTQGAHGTVTITDAATGAFQYVPAAGYSGLDNFTFDVTDPYGTTSDPGTEMVDVGDVAATAEDGGTVTKSDEAVDGFLSATPADGGQVLRFIVISQPTHGMVVVDPVSGQFTYTPATGYAGHDPFTFAVKDQYELQSNVATEDINVVDIAPIISGGVLTTNAGVSAGINLAATLAYVGQTVSYEISFQPQHGSATIDAATGHAVYTPGAGFAGTDSFGYRVTDAYGSVAATNVQVTVKDLAALALSFTVTTTVDVQVVGMLHATQGYVGQTLSYAVVNRPAHGAVTLDANTGGYTYTPATGFNGSDSFTFKATDSYGLDSNLAYAFIGVTDVAPTASDGSADTIPDVSVAGTLTAAQGAAGQTLTFSLVSQPGHGTVSLNAGTGQFNYTPASGFAGSDGFTFQVTDQYGTSSNTATEQITVADAAPTANSAAVSITPETVVSGKLSATLAYVGQTLTYSLVSNPAHGAVSLNTGNGQFRYAPKTGYVGSDSFTFQVTDAAGTPSNIATVSITVNDLAPKATGSNLRATPGRSTSGILSATKAYTGQTLTFSIVNPPARGTVHITNPNTGAYTYTPAGRLSGTDSFTFQVVDQWGTASTAVVKITVL